MQTDTWNIDIAHSGVHFSVRHMAFAKVRGRFGSWKSTIQLDENDFTRSTVTVVIDAASIDTGVADRDKHLRSADFLDVERFPELRFESKRIEKIGDDQYRIYGDCTIRDVTREVVLDAAYGGRGKDPWGNERIAFTATAALDRREFGLTWNQLLEAGGLLVGERVDVEIEIQVVKAAAAAA